MVEGGRARHGTVGAKQVGKGDGQRASHQWRRSEPESGKTNCLSVMCVQARCSQAAVPALSYFAAETPLGRRNQEEQNWRAASVRQRITNGNGPKSQGRTLKRTP